jgi:ATP-dependent Lhr-like helicase
MPAAVDILRTLRITADEDVREIVMLATTDPANPYGALMRWPATEDGAMLTRSVGARVVLIDGALVCYLRRGNANVQVLLPEDEPARSQTAKALAEFLVRQVQREENPEGRGRTSMLIATVNGMKVREHPLAKFLLDAGFQAAPVGFNVRRNVLKHDLVQKP